MRKMKKIRVTWITIWLLVVALTFSGFVGYATYTGITSLKRVVSTRSGADILFSSNYMKHGASAQVSVEYHNEEEFEENVNPAYNMTVCNFSQGDRATWYTANDLRYTLTADLYLNEKYTSADEGIDASLIGTYKRPTATDIGTKKFGIKFSSDTSYSEFSASNLTITLPLTGTYSLSKMDASTDIFSLLFDRSELQREAPRFWIFVTATPVGISDAEVETLSGYVGTCNSATAGASWIGYIDDDNYATVDYDSYNYVISGNGNGSFYFAWDESKVKPNEFAFSNYASSIDGQPTNATSWTNYKQYGTQAPTGGTWKYIKLNVNSGQLPRYEFQLYKTSGDNYGSNITKYVDYYFVAE